MVLLKNKPSDAKEKQAWQLRSSSLHGSPCLPVAVAVTSCTTAPCMDWPALSLSEWELRIRREVRRACRSFQTGKQHTRPPASSSLIDGPHWTSAQL
jgi:hypothetical protein